MACRQQPFQIQAPETPFPRNTPIITKMVCAVQLFSGVWMILLFSSQVKQRLTTSNNLPSSTCLSYTEFLWKLLKIPLTEQRDENNLFVFIPIYLSVLSLQLSSSISFSEFLSKFSHSRKNFPTMGLPWNKKAIVQRLCQRKIEPAASHVLAVRLTFPSSVFLFLNCHVYPSKVTNIWGRHCFYPCVFTVLQMMTLLNKSKIIILHKCIC